MTLMNLKNMYKILVGFFPDNYVTLHFPLNTDTQAMSVIASLSKQWKVFLVINARGNLNHQSPLI